MSRRAIALRLLALLALLAALGPATALAAAPRTTLNDVEDELMCDTCNVPLNIAESERADQERAEIRRLIAQGKTKQEILDVFAAEYGPNVLADPKGGGVAVAAWAVPSAILVLGAGALLLLLPRWRRNRGGAGAPPPSDAAGEGDGSPPPEPTAAERDRLDAELALYDR